MKNAPPTHNPERYDTHCPIPLNILPQAATKQVRFARITLNFHCATVEPPRGRAERRSFTARVTAGRSVTMLSTSVSTAPHSYALLVTAGLEDVAAASIAELLPGLTIRVLLC